MHPVGALSSDSRAVASTFVAVERLYLYDFGAHAREHEGTARASLVSSEVKQSETFEWRL